MADAARTALLSGIQALWCEVLALAPPMVQPDSHFLLLGGDSLQLARLLSRVQARFGISLPLHELSRFATPARMAACCSTAVDCAEGVEEIFIPFVATAMVPATPVQQGIWLAEQLAAPRMLYLASAQVQFTGPLDVPALRVAGTALFQRHPVLRARMLHDPATRSLQLQPASDPAPTHAATLALQDCSHTDLPQQIQQALQHAVDLAQGPLCRLQLFRLAPEQHCLLVSCHHVVCDGWSGGILLAQLAADYAAARAPGQVAVPVPAPDHAFLRYCRRAAQAHAAVTAARLQVWQQRLAGMEQAQDWLWQGRSAEPWPHDVAVMDVPLPAGLIALLRQRAGLLQHSLFTLFLHAVQAGLFACSGDSRQVLLIPVAQRRQDEEASIGCFIEPLLFAGEWQPQLGIEAVLQAAAAGFAAAQRDHVALTTLAAALRPRPLPDGNPWSSILFAFQSYPQAPLDWPGLHHRVAAVPATASQYALKLEILPGPEDWLLRIEYATALLDSSRVAALATAIIARLQRLAEA